MRWCVRIPVSWIVSSRTHLACMAQDFGDMARQIREKEQKRSKRGTRQQEGGGLLKRRGRVISLRFALEIHPFHMKLQPAPV